MTEAQSISAKYIFLDIVSYSSGRSVEAQTDIISTLNDLVRQSVAQFNLAENQLIYLPTGDGICIALLGVESPYDLDIQLPLGLLARLYGYSQQTTDEMRRFQVRIGVNANVDNIVTDINGKQNVAGAGINLAQRVMNAGDGNQVLVGESVFETLRYREKYMRAFRSFTAMAKHGIQLRVHQLVDPSLGLDTSVPSEFRSAATPELRLTNLAAYYFAHAIKNREFLKTTLRAHGMAQGTYTCLLLQYLLAYDSAGTSSATDIKPHSPRTWGTGKATLAEQFEHYNAMDFPVICELAGLLYDKHLSTFSRYFEFSGWGVYNCHFITQEGREKLRTDWPAIWHEFGFKTAL